MSVAVLGSSGKPRSTIEVMSVSGLHARIDTPKEPKLECPGCSASGESKGGVFRLAEAAPDSLGSAPGDPSERSTIRSPIPWREELECRKPEQRSQRNGQR